MSNETAAMPEWISTGDARRRLGVSQGQFAAIMSKDALTTRRLPGCRPMVLLADLERLERDSIRPASTVAPQHVN